MDVLRTKDQTDVYEKAFKQIRELENLVRSEVERIPFEEFKKRFNNIIEDLERL